MLLVRHKKYINSGKSGTKRKNAHQRRPDRTTGLDWKAKGKVKEEAEGYIDKKKEEAGEKTVADLVLARNRKR